MARSRRLGVGILLFAALFTGEIAQAQTGSLEFRRLRWPLLDIVMVPDSGGLWFMAAPNPWTTHWETDDYLVRFGIDPVVALQWTTVARKLVSASTQTRTQPSPPVPITPRLPASNGPAYVALAANPKKRPPPEERFILLASDSAADIRWKSFLSAGQVGDFLAALEATARSSREGAHPAYWRTVTDPDPDIPVRVVSQPRPAFPEWLASRGRVGRVWMSFVITAEGRADPQSFFTLLSDDSAFTEAARQALLRGRYRPATTHDKPVSQRVVQAILFRQR